MQIPHVDFGGEGEIIHLAHANGFHPMMYSDLAQEFTNSYSVNSILFRPFWEDSDYRKLKSWNMLADDLISYFDQQGMEEVIGIGHSMGAIASVLAQSKRPKLFSKLVLMEPVVLQLPKYYLTQILPLSWRQKLVPPAKISMKRQEHWESKQAAYDQLRPKRVFQNIPDSTFKSYIEYGTKENAEGGVSLSYSKAWESQVYCTGTNPWKALKSVEIPMLIIRGVKSNVLVDTTWELLKSKLPHCTFKELENGGHLVPFEQKNEISKVILDFISA